MRSLLLLLFLILFSDENYSQIVLPATFKAGLELKVTQFPEKGLRAIKDRYSKLSGSINWSSTRAIKDFKKTEEKLFTKVCKRDSSLAEEIFGDIEYRYNSCFSSLQSFDHQTEFYSNEYNANLDTLQTALKFLQEKSLFQGVLSLSGKSQVKEVYSEIQDVQDQLQKAQSIQMMFLKQQRLLKEKLSHILSNKDLVNLYRTAYYFQQKISEYQVQSTMREKVEEKIIAEIRDLPVFKEFMEKHSYFSKLFPNPNNLQPETAFTGLQTISSVQNEVKSKYELDPGSITNTLNGQSSNSNLLQNLPIEEIREKIKSVKDNLNKAGVDVTNSDLTIPDFKPNELKTKSFLKRLEYGISIQSQRSRSYLPASSDIALTAGYKISGNSILGLGVSYKLGWGDGGFNNLHLTSEGIGARSYVDIKVKGNFWATGGYEMNYLKTIGRYEVLKNFSNWQRSGLLGITKKYKAGKKENKIQLLWDFLSYNQIPRSQALQFRMGFNL